MNRAEIEQQIRKKQAEVVAQKEKMKSLSDQGNLTEEKLKEFNRAKARLNDLVMEIGELERKGEDKGDD
jgi:hypothetical protein